MSSFSSLPIIPTLLTLLSLSSPVAFSSTSTFTITNNCPYTIYPSILSGATSPSIPTSDFPLAPSQSRPIPLPPSWSGRLSAHTDPTTDTPPATLAEFTLADPSHPDSLDFFDVSLVDGFNLPLLIAPITTSNKGNCAATGCPLDLNRLCPSDLRLLIDGPDGGKSTLACRSACDAFGKDEFCCSGHYANPDTCKPSAYSQFFKKACPRAYSYAYDDATSTFTCALGTDYDITFCPAITSQKAGENIPTAVGVPLINDTMSFMGIVDTSSSIATQTWRIIYIAFVIFSLIHLFS